jgi:sulfur-oxidizing protein SoxX
MKRTVFAAAMVCLGASAASAEVAYDDIVWEDDTAVPASLTGAAGDPAEGAKVVGSKSLGNCVACHAVGDLADVPFHGEIGPELDGAGDRWTEAELRGILVDAKRTFDESLMPSFYKTSGFVRLGDRYTGKAYPADTAVTPLLTAQQIEDVVAYLMTLK